MKVTLKEFSLAAVIGWTILTILEIWTPLNVDWRLLGTAATLTVAGIIMLWIKGKQ